MAQYIKAPTFPTFIQFETNTRCNAQCTFCPHERMERHATATWSTLLKIIDEAIPTAQACCPFLYQEPLLEPRLLAILDNIKGVNRHCHVTLYTNMAAMTEPLAEQLIQSRHLDALEISFYGPNEHIYNQLQPPLPWQRTIQNIKTFMLLRTSYHTDTPTVRMHYIAMPQLLAHAQPFVATWQDIVDEVVAVHYDDFCGVMPPLDIHTEWGIWGPPAHTRTPCPRLWTQLNVLADGSVVPCCLDYDGTTPLGNVNTASLHHIWHDTPFTTLRRRHVRHEWTGLCEECHVWRYQHPQEWNAYWTQHPKP
jgi:radical SAM protein with 4Fe4S-binding SPASM domain